MKGCTDGAVSHSAPDSDLCRLLRKLARRGSYVASPEAEANREVRGRLCLVREGQAAEEISRAVFARALQAGLLERADGRQRFVLSAPGRDSVRRIVAGGLAVKTDQTGSSKTQPGFNADESPLAWLRRRRGKDGQTYISEEQFMAGERLRADFTFAQLGPRVTANWDPTCAAVGGGNSGIAGAGADMADNVVAARTRVHGALRAVGPELAGLLLDVCCFLKGLEELERGSGWPQRSGKVVLGLALSSLARHYGIRDVGHQSGSGQAQTRHWGSPGYRPALEASGEGDRPAGA